MVVRLSKTLLLLMAAWISTGCNSAPVRALQRFRDQRMASYSAQHLSAMESLESSSLAGSIPLGEPSSLAGSVPLGESSSLAGTVPLGDPLPGIPARLPAAIELPASSGTPHTLPSGVIERADTPEDAHVIFASSIASGK